MTLHLLNTRPEARAGTLTLALQAAGHRVSELPLLQLDTLTVPAAIQAAWQQPPRVREVVVVVSSLAAQQGLAQLGTGPAGRQWLAVGAVTARSLQAAGLQPGVPAQETSEGLLALPALQQAERVWLWRGLGGRELLAQTALAREQQLVAVDLYQRQPHPDRAQTWQDILQQQGFPQGVLLTSGLAAQLWQQLAGPRWAEPLLWVVGERIWRQLQAQSPSGILRGAPLHDLQPATVLAALAVAQTDGVQT